MIAKRNCPTLEVTGILRRGRLIVRFDGKDVALPPNPATALLRMIERRRNSESGYTHYSLFDKVKRNAHMTVTRLRKELNAQLGPDASDRIFIEVGRCSLYQLLIDKDDIVVWPEIRALLRWYLDADFGDGLLGTDPDC